VRPGDLSDRLSRALVKRFNIADVTMRPIGGSQSERYQAMVANLVQGVVITPPLDVRAKNDGYNITLSLDRHGPAICLQFRPCELANDP